VVLSVDAAHIRGRAKRTFVAAADFPVWLKSLSIVMLASGLGGIVGLWVDLAIGEREDKFDRAKLGGAYGASFGMGFYVVWVLYST
jgi:hypothetical protein